MDNYCRPLSLRIGKKDVFIDLGAEKLLSAEKQGQKIAVEVKSFVGKSEVEDLKNALGQYILYQNILDKLEPERCLYLAIREGVYVDLFDEEIGKLLLERQLLKLLVFIPEKGEISQWIS